MNMGALDTLKSAFTGLASFTRDYLMPIINGMYAAMGALTPIWEGLMAVVTPFTDIFKEQLDGLVNLLGGKEGISGIVTFIGDILKVLGKTISLALTPMKMLMRVSFGLSSAFFEFMQPTFDAFGSGMSVLVKGMQWLDDAIANAIDGIMSYIPPMFGGISKDEAKRRKLQRETEALLRKENEKKKKDEDEKNKATKKTTELTVAQGEAAAELLKVNKKTLDLSSPESIAQSVAAAVNGSDNSGTTTSSSGSATIAADIPANMQQYLKATALIESGGNANAKAGTSSASGMYQFINSTWDQTVKQMGKNYSRDDRFDPKKAAEVMAFFTNQQKQQLEKGTGKQASNTDLYMAHFLGAGGATKFINAMKADPNQSAAATDRKAAAANKNIYYDKSGRERSVQEVYALMQQKMANAEAASASGKYGGRDISHVNALIGGGTTAPSTIVQPVAKTATSVANTAKPTSAPTPNTATTTSTSTTTATPPPQSSTNELLISLNNKIERLISVNSMISQLSADQIRAIKGLGKPGLLVQ